MHQIKLELPRQDLVGIHLPSLRFSWKLKKLCRVNFFVLESWQTAVKSQGKTITSSAVCHDSKTNKSNSFTEFTIQKEPTFPEKIGTHTQNGQSKVDLYSRGV
jgi:hypothetical protein